MMIRRACSLDVAAIVKLSKCCWDLNSEEELAEEALMLIKAKNSVIFIVADESEMVGFAHCIAKKSISIDNKKRSHVAFIEALYTRDEHVENCVTTELIEKCIDWAKENNCVEVVSEFNTKETKLIDFHENMGFSQADNIVRYTKEI